MKYFRYWTEETFNISIDSNIEEIKLLVGSNISKEEASKDASIQAKKIEQRISERTPKEEYDAAIKEHVSEIIDESNVITICRYGAKIWNTTEYTIFDLDDYPVDFFDLFKSLRKLTKKERIIFKFEERIKRYPMLGSDFRLYETAKGIRVIGKKYIDPTGKQYSSLMRKVNVDWLYTQLSMKQNCYRARLTPKPYRMRIRTIKIKSPLDCEKDHYKEWSKAYDQKSLNFSVVKLLKSIGQDFSYDRVIKQHDEMCNAHKNYKLA
jgi:hypothetical protein